MHNGKQEGRLLLHLVEQVSVRYAKAKRDISLWLLDVSQPFPSAAYRHGSAAVIWQSSMTVWVMALGDGQA